MQLLILKPATVHCDKYVQLGSAGGHKRVRGWGDQRPSMYGSALAFVGIPIIYRILRNSSYIYKLMVDSAPCTPTASCQRAKASEASKRFTGLSSW